MTTEVSSYHSTFISLNDKNHKKLSIQDLENILTIFPMATALFQEKWLPLVFVSLFVFVCFFCSYGLNLESRYLCMLCKHSTTELHSESLSLYFNDDISWSCTRVDLLSCWKLSTKILKANKGIFIYETYFVLMTK
jgi:hypothetical protein